MTLSKAAVAAYNKGLLPLGVTAGLGFRSTYIEGAG